MAIINSPEFVNRAIYVFREWDGFEIIERILQEMPDTNCYLTGGIVRDSILGNNNIAKDFDFIIETENTKAFLDKLEINGILYKGEFLSPRWKATNNSNIYSDILFTQTFTAGLGACANVNDVLKQFDFSGNSVAINVSTGKIVNPENGVRDLCRGILSSIRGDYPNRPIRPDSQLTIRAANWFRYEQYSALLGLRIDERTKRWISTNAALEAQRDYYNAEFGSTHA